MDLSTGLQRRRGVNFIYPILNKRSLHCAMMDAPNSPAIAFNEWAKARDWPAYCDPELDFESPALIDLLAIWREQADSDAMPHRNKMTARVLKSHLGHISIIERVTEDTPRYRVRLLGSKLAQILGEMQGKYLEDAIAPEVVPHWQARLDLTLAEGRPMRFVSRVDIRKLHFLRSETFWAPLANDREPPSIVLMAAILTFSTSMSGENAAALTRFA
jgi:hypothetical protein